MTRRQALGGIILGVAWCTVPGGAAAQLPPPEQLLPPGFELDPAPAPAGMYTFEATMPQEFPPAFMSLDSRIQLTCSFTPMRTAPIVVQMMAAEPEDEASRIGMSTIEPAGKEAWEDGVIAFSKTTVPWIGEGQADDLVTWEGHWAGAVDGRLLAVAVRNALGGTEEVRGHILTVLRQAGHATAAGGGR
jgi:hypothetical protein